jgi:prevent-host-death family protein
MKVANLTDAKNDLSRLVERARRGERVRILVRGVPAADLVPVERDPADSGWEEAELAELERRGVIRRGPGGIPPALARPGPRVKGGGAVAVLLEERRGGR